MKSDFVGGAIGAIGVGVYTLGEYPKVLFISQAPNCPEILSGIALMVAGLFLVVRSEG